MDAVLSFLNELGTASVDLFWFPLVVWSVFALAGESIFRLYKKTPPIYQYHGRAAILWALPLGIAITGVVSLVPPLWESSGGAAARFFVIANPISVEAVASGQALYWYNPNVLAGLLTVSAALAGLAGMIRFGVHIIKLNHLIRIIRTDAAALPWARLTRENRRIVAECAQTTILFSHRIDVPCTFGWQQKWILLPPSLRGDAERINLAVRHELMHIHQHDYLINMSLKCIKALFLVHPLVHVLERQIEEYRELYCDQNVLASPGISRKSYARLLFELASHNVFRSTAAVSMAVHPSTLKKRIKIMQSSSPGIPSIKRSVALMVIIGLLCTGIMACSDMEQNGITKDEVENMQSEMTNTESGMPDINKKPLFIVNGELMDKKMDLVSRIDPSYIKSIDVLKGETAVEEYGQKAINGVVKITLADKEAAFNNLKPASDNASSAASGESNNYFIVVDSPPELNGGLQRLQSRISYPQEAREAGIEGRVIIQFIVNEQGEVEQPNAIRSHGHGLDEEAIRVVKEATFVPGKQNGQPVRVQMSIPILFSL